MKPLLLKLDRVEFTDEQFYQLCCNHDELRFERSPQGDLVIMPPVGGDSGKREADFIADLVIWNRQTRLGYVFSSSTIFRLPNGASRSPDVAWVQRERYLELTPEDRRKFPPIVPDFVIELRSATDSLPMLRAKMQEYQEVGVRLGWLVNPQQQQVEIYRLQEAVDVRDLPVDLSGEDVLPGFQLRIGDYTEED